MTATSGVSTITKSQKGKVETGGGNPASLPVRLALKRPKEQRMIDKAIERLAKVAMVYASIVILGHVIVAVWRAL